MKLVEQQAFKHLKLEVIEDSVKLLTDHAHTWIARMMSGKLQGYRVWISTDEDDTWKRTCILIRICEGDNQRALATMSFNYYWRDPVTKVKRRLDARLVAYAERVLPRLKSPEDLARRQRQRDIDRARKAKVAAELGTKSMALLDQELAVLDELLGDPSPL